MLYEDKITIYINETEKDELLDSLNKYKELENERKVKMVRGKYLSEYKEELVELLVFFIATKDEFPKNFEELEALVDEENKEGVAVAKEAFQDDFVEALCSIKMEVPECLLNDEYATVLAKFSKSIYFKDAKQDWYKKKNYIISVDKYKTIRKNFDVSKRVYAELYVIPLSAYENEIE
jgi:hypothetical protein